MTQNPTSGTNPDENLSDLGQAPQGTSGVENEGPADSGAGELGVPDEQDGGADGGADEAEGPADSGADEPAVPGEHDGGADGGADGSQ